MIRRLAITMGDPAGIGPEIVVKALNQSLLANTGVVVVGDSGRLRDAATRCGLRSFFRPYSPLDATSAEPMLLDLQNVPADLPYGKSSKTAGAAALAYVRSAAQLALAGQVRAVVTAPINKEAAQSSGQKITGHTEFLAALTSTATVRMMLVSDSLRVAHVSTHVSLRQAIRLVTEERVETTIRLAHDFLVGKLGLSTPRIAVAGLNPHAGEGGMFGSEDAVVLEPVCRRLQELGTSGPYPPDTVFLRAARGEFDAVIAQYHDQGHIAMKMIGLDAGVNVTLGLPFVRTSVDHGTAFDIAGTGQASPTSLIRAINMAVVMLERATG